MEARELRTTSSLMIPSRLPSAQRGTLPVQEVMEARELRTTSSLMTIVVLAGITGFLALVVLKNTLQVRQ